MRDVIIIGAGGGGPVAAKELAGRGLDVLLLEAGPRFADPETEWSQYENDAYNPITGYFRFGPADRSKPAWFRELAQPSALIQAAGVGGTTLMYYANCPRAMPGVFAGYEGPDRELYDRRHRFPFGYKELVPYYEWVEATLPVQTAPMGTKEELFFAGAKRIGLSYNRSKDITGASYRPQENAILQPGGTAGKTNDSSMLLYPQATGCTFCGPCYRGCVQPRRAPRNLKAKRSTDASYIPMALTADRWSAGGRPIELRPESFATRVLQDQRGSTTVAVGVEWRDGRTGEMHEERAHVVVMACGATEDPRLWFNSDLPNPNDWVGRGYTNHWLDMLVGKFDTFTGCSRGPGSAARVDYPGYGMIEQTGYMPMGLSASFISLSGIQGFYENGPALDGPWDGHAGRMVGRELKEFVADIDQLLPAWPITDDHVDPQNRVVISSMPGDEHGPIAKVVFPPRRQTRRTIENREFLARRTAELLRAAGAHKVVRFNLAPIFLHVHSTMRMGDSASDSVLRPTGEARFVDRLYVASNAALANGVGGPNPTLTTQALATRTAEHLMKKYFDGDPWVLAESPVCSTDDRVTEGVLAGAK